MNNDYLYDQASLAKQIKLFFDTPMGKHILKSSADEVERCLLQLRTCKPEELSKIQDKILVAEKAIVWLENALHVGMQALRVLDDERRG